ncbi:MAG: hypothetical protein NT002_05095, partial [candidate division Zixibacteria bacterium]|nr:hypothetical protein [candidate division Zixibacteria bacterium]
MFRSRLIIILLAISTLMFALVPPAFGGVKAKPKGIFALKIGLLGSGPVGFEEEIGKWMKENGLAVGIALDYPVTKRLYLGIFADVHSIKIPRNLPFWVNSGKEDTKDLLNFGFSFKMRATEQGRALVFRPGIGFGYAILKDMPY